MVAAMKSNTTPNHDTGCRISGGMHNAAVQQPLTKVSSNSNPIIVMLQAEVGFVVPSSSCDCGIGAEEKVEHVLLLCSKLEIKQELLKLVFKELDINGPPNLQQRLSTRSAFKKFYEFDIECFKDERNVSCDDEDWAVHRRQPLRTMCYDSNRFKNRYFAERIAIPRWKGWLVSSVGITPSAKKKRITTLLSSFLLGVDWPDNCHVGRSTTLQRLRGKT
ncbi:hypothetical protein TNCV_2866841 [Trichonephila clavipes]|nr:hypothetical protein TNCV_2866841 [Trichonephila clavipes]